MNPMANRRIHIAVLAALLGACATAQDVDRAKGSWQGATYEEVLRAWGAPVRSTTTNDGRYWYTWETAAVAQPPPSVGFGIGGVSIGGRGATGVGVGMGVPVGSPPAPERCERTLIFENGRVVDQSWQGPPSMCADFKRP
jgi:hypothetical protein